MMIDTVWTETIRKFVRRRHDTFTMDASVGGVVTLLLLCALLLPLKIFRSAGGEDLFRRIEETHHLGGFFFVSRNPVSCLVKIGTGGGLLFSLAELLIESLGI
jgi:hypothetical protein